MQSIRTLPLLFHTVRYLTIRQLAYRSRAIARRRWWLVQKRKAPQVRDCGIGDFDPLYEGARDICKWGYVTEVLDKAVKRAFDISQGRFDFLTRRVCYENRVNWEDPDVSQLWRYNLHYFDYVNDLLVWSSSGSGDKAYGAFQGLAASWMEGNRILKGDGWHPYTVSLRIVNWINAYGYWRSAFDREPAFSRRFLGSLYGQARFLAANLEHDVRGNHLLKNLKALIWAGVAFDGKEARRWCEEAITGYQMKR